MSDETAWQRVVREHAMFAEGTGGPCNCAACQASRATAALTAERNRLREALDVALPRLRGLAGEHGNRNGVDWCHGPCAHPDCIAHLALEAVARVLKAQT